MSRKTIILAILLLVTFLSAICLILPENFAHLYTGFLQTIALFVGFILAIKVASNYNREVKYSFIFLGLFLLMYCFSSISFLWENIFKLFNNPDKYLFSVIFAQIITYAMLIISCFYTLKVIQIKRLNKWGWTILTILSVICIYIIIYGIPEMRENFHTIPVIAVSEMLIRIFDMAVILMLTPVLLLYIQYMKARAQDSVTYTLVMTGVIISLLSTYIFQLANNISMSQIAERYFQRGSFLDVAYLFGYLLIVAGLYAHMKYDEWGYKMIERALG